MVMVPARIWGAGAGWEALMGAVGCKKHLGDDGGHDGSAPLAVALPRADASLCQALSGRSMLNASGSEQPPTARLRHVERSRGSRSTDLQERQPLSLQAPRAQGCGRSDWEKAAGSQL